MAGRPWQAKARMGPRGAPWQRDRGSARHREAPSLRPPGRTKNATAGGAPATKPTKADSTKAWGAPWRRVSVSASPKNTDELACKPDPVPVAPCGAAGGGHPSRPAVAGRLQRPTRRLGRAVLDRLRRSVLPFGLAPGGVYLAIPVTRDAGGLLHHRFTLTPAEAGAVCFLWHCPAGRPGLPLTTTLPCGVRTFLGPGCPGSRPPCQLVRLVILLVARDGAVFAVVCAAVCAAPAGAGLGGDLVVAAGGCGVLAGEFGGPVEDGGGAVEADEPDEAAS